MYQRLLKPSKQNSFFLFGARGTGKSSLVNTEFAQNENVLFIDFLQTQTELDFIARPDRLLEIYEANTKKPQWIVLDEIQRVPKLLDVVHHMIEKYKTKFVLTGSSARKLRRGGANMLGGRAHEFNLYPLSFLEMGPDFKLEHALNYGTLPRLFSADYLETREKILHLKSYVNTYLKQEVIAEQLIRAIEPFQRFLEVAAQTNGEILNLSKLGRQAKIDDKSAERYYQILVDTLMGFYLPAYHPSIKKQLIHSPKFYFFDIGVTRALRSQLSFELSPSTYEYGKAFEHFVILEIFKLSHYFEKDFKLYFLKTKEGTEVDLVIETPKNEVFFIEIKSSRELIKDDVSSLISMSSYFPKAKLFVFYQGKEELMMSDKVLCLPWKKGIEKIFEYKR
jgi:predicted AAA+ superfamily ATPase